MEKASIRPVWAIILKEALIKLKGMYVGEDEERLRKTTEYVISVRSSPAQDMNSEHPKYNAEMLN